MLLPSPSKAHSLSSTESEQPSEAEVKQGEEEAANNVRNFAVGCLVLYFSEPVKTPLVYEGTAFADNVSLRIVSTSPRRLRREAAVNNVVTFESQAVILFTRRSNGLGYVQQRIDTNLPAQHCMGKKDDHETTYHETTSETALIENIIVHYQTRLIRWFVKLPRSLESPRAPKSLSNSNKKASRTNFWGDAERRVHHHLPIREVAVAVLDCFSQSAYSCCTSSNSFCRCRN